MLATSAKANPRNWENHIRAVCFAYNTSIHTSTGYSPFYLMYGREARLPVDLTFPFHTSSLVPSYPTYAQELQSSLTSAYDLARTTLGDAQFRQKMLYDRKIHGEPFKEGDLVWLHSTVIPPHSCRKLHHPWCDPYQVMKKLSDINYVVAPVDQLNKHSIVHFDRLKLCPSTLRFSELLHDATPDVSETCSSPRRQYAGEGAKLFSDESVTPGDAPVTSGPTSRYPRRLRRPPDRLAPTVAH